VLPGKHHNSFGLASSIFPAQSVSRINLAEPSKAPKMATLPCRALVFSSGLLAPSLKSVWFSFVVLLVIIGFAWTRAMQHAGYFSRPSIFSF